MRIVQWKSTRESIPLFVAKDMFSSSNRLQTDVTVTFGHYMTSKNMLWTIYLCVHFFSRNYREISDCVLRQISASLLLYFFASIHMNARFIHNFWVVRAFFLLFAQLIRLLFIVFCTFEMFSHNHHTHLNGIETSRKWILFYCIWCGLNRNVTILYYFWLFWWSSQRVINEIRPVLAQMF